MNPNLYAMNSKHYIKEGKIDISDKGIIYWARKINCEPEDLKQAVSKIGNDFNVLVLFLELNRRIRRTPIYRALKK